jgi:hypothetical protein
MEGGRYAYAQAGLWALGLPGPAQAPKEAGEAWGPELVRQAPELRARFGPTPGQVFGPGPRTYCPPK